MKTVRVFIADDHTLFREGLEALLATAPEVEVVGTAADGVEAVAGVRAKHPDVVLMDIQMPRMNGIEAARAILAAEPQIAIVALTMFEDDDSVFAAMRAGARGYILKGADQAELLRAIQAAANGEALFGPEVARRILDYLGGGRGGLPAKAFPGLTERERELLDLMARGHTNTQIAAMLVISPKTVRNHISNIFAKLQVAGRPEAIVRAREAGFGSAGGEGRAAGSTGNQG
ncbi:MAG TPA: response regulator transcription factor [Dehalococcoidia bacterium]|nr:response regulator transcription factor [Dehalococcoidia bacterium]